VDEPSCCSSVVSLCKQDDGSIIAANAQSRTGQQHIASRSVIGGSIAPTNVRKRAMPERLLTVEDAGEILNMGSVFRVG
jgi:hypothetical protein